jgi:hypothetical protein
MKEQTDAIYEAWLESDVRELWTRGKELSPVSYFEAGYAAALEAGKAVDENGLKPCPFRPSHRRPAVPEDPLYLDKRHERWQVVCPRCGTRGVGQETREQAITAWNRRTGDAG